MAESHLLDALRCCTDLTVASQILPPRKGIPRLRRGHHAMIIGASGLGSDRLLRGRARIDFRIRAGSNSATAREDHRSTSAPNAQQNGAQINGETGRLANTPNVTCRPKQP